MGQEPQNEASTNYLGPVLSICLRRLPLVLWTAAAIATLVLVASFIITPLYEANARLVVDTGRKTVEFDRESAQPKDDEYSLLNTQKELLLSNTVLQAALKQTGLGLEKEYADSPDPLSLFRRRLKVITSKDSLMIDVSFRHRDARRAEQVLATVLDVFLINENHRDANRSSSALTFLDQQVDVARANLDKARASEQKFRSDNAILSSDPDHNHIAQELATSTEKRVTLMQDFLASKAVMDQITRCGALEDPAARQRGLLEIGEIKHDPLVNQQQEALYALRDRATQLAQKYKPAHPHMMEVTEQIKASEGRLAEAVAGARAARETSHAALSKQLEDVDRGIATLQADLTRYRDNLMKMEALSRERETNEQLFEHLLTRLREEEVSSRLGVQTVSVVDPPFAVDKAVNISRLLSLVSALMLGGLAGVVTALGMEAIDWRVRNDESLRELTDTSLLGSVPHVDRLGYLGRGTDPKMGANVTAERHVDESFRILRVSLQLADPGVEVAARVIMIASSAPGEGRSTVASRLAHSMAVSGRKVLLIDADLRGPSLDLHLGEQRSSGFSEMLAGDETAAPVATSYPNLDLLSAGYPSDSAAELLHDRHLKQSLDQLRDQYDLIVIDTPPLGLYSDALALGTLVDDIIVVVRDRFTAKAALRTALARLGRLRQRVIGMVFNDDHQFDVAGYIKTARAARGAPLPLGDKIKSDEWKMTSAEHRVELARRQMAAEAEPGRETKGGGA